MNAEMVRLGEKHAIGKATWNRLMRMTSDKRRDFWKLRSQRHHRVRKIIATAAHFQSHVARQNNRICTLALCLRDGAANGLDGMLKLDPAREFRDQPKRNSRC